MKKGYADITAILDRSGSMSGSEGEVIKGFNSFIEKQAKELGETKVTLILFDVEYWVVYNGVDIKKVEPLSDKQYYPRGMTALRDAVGRGINEAQERFSRLSDKDEPERVMFVIYTDGQENSSREFTQQQVKGLVEEKQKGNWDFIFMGADINAFAEGASIGTWSASTIGTTKTGDGIAKSFNILSQSMSNHRAAYSTDSDAVYSFTDEEREEVKDT